MAVREGPRRVAAGGASDLMRDRFVVRAKALCRTFELRLPILMAPIA